MQGEPRRSHIISTSRAELAIFSDASDFAVGAVLQQKVNDHWPPLDFFSKKLSPTESNYGAYDRELLAVYLAVKHFRHMVEAQSFIIYTDHKPFTYAFQKKNTESSPRQIRHLDFISQFTTDIRHNAGSENVVADALSRIEAFQTSIDFQALAAAQQQNEELERFQTGNTGLQSGTNPSILPRLHANSASFRHRVVSPSFIRINPPSNPSRH